MRINAEGVPYRQLNEQIRAAVESGVDELTLDNVKGHRYIGVGISADVSITINGVPGNDLAAFMNGARITVSGNAQDGVGNTMNSGKVVIHGDAGDILGHSMRGGRIFVRGNVGYRAGIHIKAYGDRFPVVVIGGIARDYFGEYMAGGVLAVLNSGGRGGSAVGDYVGTGMHGGVIYIRGPLEPHQLGAEVGVDMVQDSDWAALRDIIAEYCRDVGFADEDFAREEFVKLIPQTSRPYGRLYAY